jgi:2-polyprenyl-6-methoxyphenol hydroxylase-like FAD-dependent oxidoreductase
MSSSRQAVIVGGGIAGLASAIGLSRGGWSCAVLEQSPHRRGQGHGMLMSSAGSAALEALGVGPIEAFSAPIDAFAVCEPDGTVRREFAIPGSLSLLHYDLVERLERALPTAVAYHSARCVALERTPDGRTRVVTAIDQRWAGEVIVAADGVGSRCRTLIFPTARLTPEQVTELGLVVQDRALARRLRHCCRKFQHPSAGLAIGLVPCRDDQVVV